MVDCKDCIWFKRPPYEAKREGCWHPKHLKVQQKDRFLAEQQLPGDHRKINLRGDCPDFEPRPRKKPWWRRFLDWLAPEDENEVLFDG